MARELAEVVDFGRYEPLFRIGIGGMAEVYAARIRGEAGFQKLVAVKRMLPHLGGDQKFVDMFLDEARLAANISSPHVVGTLDLGRADDETLYLVMELILGVTISEMLRYMGEQRKYVDLPTCIELIAQAAQGIDDAHEARAPNGEPMHLVHRDVSPQNILVGVDGRARVTDFGIAHALLLRRTETQVGEMKGKFAYYSPEQAFGKSIDRRSDVFALGVVGWELVTGRRLFKGTPADQLKGVKTAHITPPNRIRQDVPAEISNALMKAVERDREQRWPTGAAFAAALRRAALGIGEAPTARAIGRFVAEVGGERLARMQECIAGTQELPSDVGKATALIDGRGLGTEVLSVPTSVPEPTFLFGDDDLDAALDRPYDAGETSASSRDGGADETVRRASQPGIQRVPGGIADLPTQTLAPSGPGDSSLEQARTRLWSASSEPGPETRSSRTIAAALGALAILGTAIAVAVWIAGRAPADPSVGSVSTPPASEVSAPSVDDVVPEEAAAPPVPDPATSMESEPLVETREEPIEEEVVSEPRNVRTGMSTRRGGMRAMTEPVVTTMEEPVETAMTSPNPLPVWPGNH